MSGEPEVDLGTLLETWADAKMGLLARKIVAKLKRIPASGCVPEYTFKSVWGEYSFDLQNGPDWYSERLVDLVDEVISHVIDGVPTEDFAVLQWVAVSNDTEVAVTLKERLGNLAFERELDRYADNYRWYENV